MLRQVRLAHHTRASSAAVAFESVVLVFVLRFCAASPYYSFLSASFVSVAVASDVSSASFLSELDSAAAASVLSSFFSLVPFVSSFFSSTAASVVPFSS